MWSLCHVAQGVKSRELKRKHHRHRSGSRRSWETIFQSRQTSEGLNKDDVVDEDKGEYKFTVSYNDLIIMITLFPLLVYCPQ